MSYLKTAIDAARAAGAVHRKYFRRNLKVRRKSASFDLVTAADTDAEKAAVAVIRKACPGHNFLCEEGVYERTPSEYTWIIDPLDGTNNFAGGMPIFCASVALAYKSDVIAGAVYDMTREELFYARKGAGAFLNGRRIRVNSVRSLSRAVLITGFYYSRGAEMVETLETMRRFLVKRVLGVRRLGAAALDLCYVACGRAAGFWEFQLSPWDFAAGKLFVGEAGGRVTGRRGENVPLMEKHYIVASNGVIHRRMLNVINGE